MTRLRKWVLLGGIAISVSALTGCGTGNDEDSPPPSPDPVSGSAVDYEPATGPTEIARSKYTDLVVRGTAGEPAKGRIWADSPDDEFGALTSTVISISVESVEAGNLPAQSHGTVYLELQRGPGDSADWIQGRSGIFYVSRLPDQFDPADGIHPLDPKSGRPSGQPMFQPAHPEGILVESDNAGVRSVEAGIDYPGADLDAFLPEKKRFPDSRP